MSDQKKPAFDEQTLAKLLEAAYILQEHNRERRKSESERETSTNRGPERPDANTVPPAAATPAPSFATGSLLRATPQQDYDRVLEQVVEAQQRIQAGHLSRQSSLMLLAEQAVDIAHASGAAIAFLDGEQMHYEAVAGTTMMPAGAVIPVEDAMSAIAVRTGEAFRCAEIDPVILPDIEQCRRSGVLAFIAVPIFLHEKVAGALEVYYSNPQAFSEQDVHACQLVSGLIAEVAERDAKPARMSASANSGGSHAIVTPAANERPASNASILTSFLNTSPCHNCGHELLEHEQFCGECGTKRAGTYDVLKPGSPAPAPNTAPDSLLTNSSVSALTKPDLSWASSLKSQMPELFEATEIAPHADLESADLESSELESSTGEQPAVKTEESPVAVEETAASEPLVLSKPPVVADWSSATSARAFLEQMAGNQRRNSARRLWNERRGDIYLAIAVLLVACVIRWGIWYSPSVNATTAPAKANAAHQKSPEDNLSAFDRMLISLGLAEAPEPPVDKGNPSAQVWIDLHTALYYCPGADMYGKTPTGKYASQRDAQLDSFEPAYRKVCQ